MCLYGEVGRITKASRHISIMKEEHSNIVKQLLLYDRGEGGRSFYFTHILSA